MAGGGNDMKVNQVNLCLTKSVCTLGISCWGFFWQETFITSLRLAHEAAFALTLERHKLALTEDPARVKISTKTELGTWVFYSAIQPS